VEDKKRAGRPKLIEVAELEKALLDEDPCQTQEEHALGVARSTFSCI